MLTDGRTDGRRTTDARVTGILIAHLGAFGSGELIKEDKGVFVTEYLNQSIIIMHLQIKEIYSVTKCETSEINYI